MVLGAGSIPALGTIINPKTKTTMEEKSHVALTKCYFCQKDNEILLATRFNRTKDGKLNPSIDMNKFHEKVVDKRPCTECEKLMKQGVILISVSNDSKNGEENPFRTGGWVVITDEAFERITGNKPTARMAFIADEAWKKIGLPLSEY